MKKIILSLVCLLATLLTNAQNTQFDWAIGDNHSWFDEGKCLDVDANGNVYVSGNLYGTTDFDPSANTYTLTSAGGNDVFIAKYDALGNFIWAKRLGNSGEDYSYSLGIDSIGNVYVTGRFAGVVDFDPGIGTYTIAASSGGDYVLKLDGNGNFIWAKQFLGAVQPNITSDHLGNILITGFNNDTCDLDPGIGVFKLGTVGSIGGQFILKLNSQGNFVWAKRVLLSDLSTSFSSLTYSIKTDYLGNIYTTGYFTNTIVLNPGGLSYSVTTTGGNDAFVSKLDSSGNFKWAKQFGSSGWDAATAVTLDNNGNAYVTGIFFNTVDFDPSASVYNLSSSGQDDVFILKLDSLGNFIWAKQIGGSDYQNTQAIQLDGSGNIYTGAWFKSSVDVDPSSAIYNLTSTGDSDAYILKLDNNGNFIWAKQIGGTKYDDVRSIFVDASNNVYTAGNYTGIVDLDPNAGVFNLNSDTVYGGFYIQKLNQTSVGIKENQQFNGISIYPNPSSTFLNIAINNYNDEPVSFQILNSLGEVLIEEVLSGSLSKLNIQHLISGMYFIKVSQKEKHSAMKFIKE